MIKEANELFKNGQYRDAITHYINAIDRYPEMADSLKFNIEIAKKKFLEQNPLAAETEGLGSLRPSALLLDGRSSAVEQFSENSFLFHESKISSASALEGSSKAEFLQSVFIGIAAIPEREYALSEVIKSLVDQVEHIGVYLNGWTSIPEFLLHPKIKIAGFGEKDLGDVGKFYWVDDHDGIYFTCDDDLVYPADYVQRTLQKLKQFEFKAAVGWHGSLLKAPFSDYYDVKSRRVFSFSAHRPYDTPVHILGTGCCAFYTKIFPIKFADFLAPNMADVFFALKGQKLRIPFYVIEHGKGEISEVDGAKVSSIYADSHANVKSKKNTAELQNRYVSSHESWVTHDVQSMSILLIGRFESYSKGGIYKSCKLIQDQLEMQGHKVKVLDTQRELTASLLSDVDLCWIYPGDPERPDFSTVDEKIRKLQSQNIPVLVNLSYLNDLVRPKFIREKLLNYNGQGKSPVMAAVFTESAAYDPVLADVREYVTVVPKTILPTDSKIQLSFSEREGICLGDATKLTNEKILGGSIHPWVEAIHRRLPHVNLYAYKQYSGSSPHPKIQYVPHMTDNFGDWLAERRIFICANINLTFEMVACEAQQYGTPVVYRHMPHSLSEYISATGIAVRDAEEMGEMVAWLYNDQASWEKISQSSRYNGLSNHVDFLSSSLTGYLRLALFRAKQLSRTGVSLA